MQGLAHFAVGAAICRYTRWRPVGLALAFASHFALDALPHFEDPSLLPHLLRCLGGAAWPWTLLALTAAVVPLAVLVWRRFGGGASGSSRAAYLIAGGLLACLPDASRVLLGGNTLIGHWNDLAHLVWTPPYYRLLAGPHPWRAAIASGCLLSEAGALLSGLWLVLRHSWRRADAAYPREHALRGTLRGRYCEDP